MTRSGSEDLVSRVLESAVETGVTAGAVALVRHRGQVIYHRAFGQRAAYPDSLPMTEGVMFDLASLTKPLVGGALTLAMVDRGVISLDEEISNWLPELQSLAGQGVTFRRLLAHTAGLPGWRPLYAHGLGRPSVLKTVDQLGLSAPPGSRFEYSDIGFVTLGLALERAGDAELHELASSLIFRPLGLERTMYRPDGDHGNFAVTEKGNAFERRMAEWAGLEFDGWRTDFHPGEVNDGNAHYALGGVSANAGLFSTAEEMGVMGQMWLDRGSTDADRILSAAAVDLAIEDHGFKRGLGWQLMTRTAPGIDDLTRAEAGLFPPARSPWTPRSSGEFLSQSSFGHTGFTGTSMWIDPERSLCAVLLSNATHPAVEIDKPLNALRARFHNVVVSSIQAAQ